MSEKSDSQDEVICEVQDTACWIRLNRPQVMNALNPATLRRFAEAIASGADDPRIRTIVITGNGGRAFSAGGDLREWSAATPEQRVDAEEDCIEAFAALRRCEKPTVAAIDGHCMGAGMEIASLCDIRVATEQSQFALPEARHALMPDPGLIELPRILPRGELLQMLFTGRPLSAQRAFDIGFVQRLVPDRAALFISVQKIASDIALGAPLAIEAFKHIVRDTESPLTARAGQLRDPLWRKLRHFEG